MTTSGDNLSDASDLPGDDESEAEVDEFTTEEDTDVSADLDDFDPDSDDDGESVDGLVESALSPKAQDARSLEIRRAIEERLENRRQKLDIDYLDFDFDD